MTVSSGNDSGQIDGRTPVAPFPDARKPLRTTGRMRGVLGPVLRHGSMVLMLSLAPCLLSEARAQVPNEYEVKAAFLYNFIKFVDWPQPSKPVQEPLLICVIGDDPFGASLDKIVEGKHANGRSLQVRRFNRADDAKSCEIAFVSASEKTHLRSILEALKGANTLTVGDTPRFAEMGGVINLVLQDNLVHFEINVDAARSHGLTISSRLLGLARIVRTKSD